MLGEKNALWSLKELTSQNRNSNEEISGSKLQPMIEAIKMVLGFFLAPFSSSMFFTKKPFTCFLKAIMRASPTKAKYSWQKNNSNQLTITFCWAGFFLIFWEAIFNECKFFENQICFNSLQLPPWHCNQHVSSPRHSTPKPIDLSDNHPLCKGMVLQCFKGQTESNTNVAPSTFKIEVLFVGVFSQSL